MTYSLLLAQCYYVYFRLAQGMACTLVLAHYTRYALNNTSRWH